MSDDNLRDRARHTFAARFGELTMAQEWWVPGRLELLGKHVDYGGGRSLLAAVDRGIHVVARPRSDGMVHITDARSRKSFSASLDPAPAATPGRWTAYPVSVIRRIARDFPGVRHGMDVVLVSSLPSAAGLSSSSAVVIATFLPLASFNRLDESETWQEHLAEPGALPGYLGSIENGRAFGPFAADFGVGTQGGSQDHTAILAAESGRVSQFRFLPVVAEASVALPLEWEIVVATSGVSASKTGGAQSQYNKLASDMATIVDNWNRYDTPKTQSLLTALESSETASERLTRRLAGNPEGAQLVARLHQFETETRAIIPAVRLGLSQADADMVGAAIDRSELLAETVLANQVPETISLVRSARELGAIAASAFGAGFGGSVYAIVSRSARADFLDHWRANYRREYPERSARSEFFVSSAAAGARLLSPA